MSGSAAFFAFALPALAQVELGLEFATQIGLTTTDVRTTVARIISYFLGFLGIVAVCIMLYAGFLWMTAGGNEEKVSTAKKWMINGVIGLIIIMSAFAITQFILRAITGDAGLTGSGCLPGQQCGGPPGGIGGGAGGFRVSGVAPAGPGPQNGGWPKNYSLTIGFNSDVVETSVTSSSVIVKKCNARIDGGGEAQEFDLNDCDEAVSGTRTVEGTRVVFKPNATPGDEPTDFEGEFWYYLQVVGGTVQDTRGRTLLCPSVTGDISAQSAPGNLCDRAIAINNLRDVAPPTVEVTVPRSMPVYCAATIPVQAIGRDDFLVSRIDFSLDGAEVGLSSASEVNGALLNPFSVDSITIDAGELAIGEHFVAATAFDGVPQQSTVAQSRFIVPPANCCNGVQDGNEEGVDCGVDSGCGECNGSSCTEDDDCQSGFCENGVCAERPIILTVSTDDAGPGSLVTIRGQFFGTAEGQVIFMGDPTDTEDDKVAAACADGAWRELSPEEPGMFEVVVAVPEGAADGPLKLVTAAGRSDTTEATSPPGTEMTFTVTDETLPGICRLTPSAGPAGSSVVINGTGFQETRPDDAVVTMGANDVSVRTWTATSITGDVPSIRDGAYPVKVRVGGDESNTVNFAIRPAAGAQKPEITAIVPDNAPPNAFITIQGRGFGSAGTVRFFFGEDDPDTGPDEREVAVGIAPAACSDYWHNNYVVVKVPENYLTNPTQGINRSPPDGVHQVQIETVGPPQSSNVVDFTVIDGSAGPGICSIMPPAGPAGIDVTITGEGFGNADILGGEVGDDSVPRNVVNFFRAQVDEDVETMPAVDYGTWTLGAIGAVVPGSNADPDSWPKTGPVSVVASNEPSSNAVPFVVADCNAVGGDAFCKLHDNELICCETGACDTSCGPEARVSAFGWRFSTDVLPALPRVVEQATCSVNPQTIQSPSPYKNSQDACINAAIRFQFNTRMKPSSFSTTTVTLEDCGEEPEPDCSSPADGVEYNGNLGPGEVLADSIYRMTPTASLLPRHWYQVTLVSQPPLGVTDSLDRALDGDANNISGGDYRYMFRVRDSELACALASVAVLPFKYNVDHQGAPESVENSGSVPNGFFSDLQAGNCNPLVCSVDGADQYGIAWSTTGALNDIGALDLSPHPNAPAGDCDVQYQPVVADRETQSPAGLRLNAEGRRLTSDVDNLRRTGYSTVTAKFSDPVVTAYAPNCDEACVNARIYAVFNISMDGDGNDTDTLPATNTLTESNVQLLKCRNEACNPPYDIVPVDLVMTGETGTEAPEVVDGYVLNRGVELVPATLLPNTFYLVRLRGGENGIKSSSGVPLTGLNDGTNFVWRFRTKNNATPCVPNRSVVSPREAILLYNEDKLPFKVTPFGAPDECDAQGQALRGDDYNWLWTNSEQVIEGFLPDKFVDPPFVQTQPGQNASCTASCLNAGSQNVVPQCGNGLPLEPGEDCEKTGPGFPEGCDPTSCLWSGFSNEFCGNNTPDPGEQCDQKVCVGGTSPETVCALDSDCGSGGSCQFIPGCKDPDVHLDGRDDLDGLGCVWIGSAAGGSACGDGFIADGESCDDGNRANGDGCSSDCINEGTLPSCSTGVTPCVNFCGNGITEAGEDDDCDLGPGNVSSACDEKTCLKKGTPPCGGSLVDNCCGNRITEDEAGEECDSTEGCSSSCLNAGSSFLYSTPSFCRDGGLPGIGEEARCEVGSVTDQNTDPFQYIVGRSPPLAAPGAPAETFMSTVTATLPGITAQNEGKAQVTLLRACMPPATQDTCRELGEQMIPPVALGCTPGGFCAAAPTVSSVYPGYGSLDICRNTVVRVNFSRAMNALSVQNNMQVGVETPSGNCGFVCNNDNGRICSNDDDCEDEGQCNAPRPTVGQSVAMAPSAQPQGWLARLWGRVVSFFKGVFAPFVSAAGDTPDTGATYCLVPGTISVVGGVATWGPRKLLDDDAWYRVFVQGVVEGEPEKGVRAANTVPLQTSYYSYFKTGLEICRIDFVAVDPPSHLFSTSEDLGPANDDRDLLDGDHTFTARAHPAGRGPEAEIFSTEEYAYKWRWSLHPTTGPKPSTILVTPQTLPLPPSETNGWCENNEPADSADCEVDLTAAAIPKPAPGCGNEICEAASTSPARAKETAATCPSDCDYEPLEQGPTAIVKVRTGLCSNDTARACNTNADCTAPGSCDQTQGFPHNGDEVVQVTADISERRVLKSHVSAKSDVVVMLCSNPWPSRKFCPTSGDDTGRIHLAWDPGVDGPDAGTEPDGLACTPGDFVWHPFYDKERDTSFYYCRDGASAGAEGDLLPELKESVVSIAPGRDVLREYLFTFVAPGPKDAIGFRIVTNGDHKGIRSWYSNQGFRGNPTDTLVDGYDALQEGRTVYVNAAALVVDKLYTNVNILSYSDAAAPETVNIFNQFLGSIDMNRNVKDLNFCVDGKGDQVELKFCSGGSSDGKLCTKDAECGTGNPTPTCRAKQGQAPIPMGCESDSQCRTDSDGKLLALRGSVCSEDEAKTCLTDDDCSGRCLTGYTCAAAKSKLIRDVARWRDIHAMRDALVSAKRNGALPTLEAGSFLRARSNSLWPSWTALSAAVGGPPPSDPINLHMSCNGDGFDPVSCWNATARLYQCPKDSHVYEFQSIGGQDFRLRVDFEARCEQFKHQVACNAQGFCNWNDIDDEDPLTGSCAPAGSWSGSTCVEKKIQGDCTGSLCVWDAVNSACLYREGSLELGGVNNIAGVCQSTTVSSESGICGDGVVQTSSNTCREGSCSHDAGRSCSNDADCNEECEPNGPPDIGSCSVTRVCDKNPAVACAVDSDCGASGPCETLPSPRTGSHSRSCTLNCTWTDFNACRAGVCGDGFVQPPAEVCDDGVQNGTFGHCLSDCTGFGPRCGDGQKEINEACDCAEKNGAYDFNGRLGGVNSACSVPYPLNTAVTLNSCAWDCSGPGPYCGDGILNGPEQCDGGFEEFRGFCDDPLQTGCDSNAQCNFGACVNNRCAGNASVACSSDTQCAKTCGNYCATPEQRNRRECGDPLKPAATQVNDVSTTADDPSDNVDGNPSVDARPKACRWSGWSCTAPGSCGNGTKETGEECDDGNTDNTDGCIIDPARNYFCKTARCADGYVSATNLETCDLGKDNGKVCAPQYGLECNYCTSQCKTGTISGGFCGNNLIEDGTRVPPGPEQCEGTQGMADWICTSTKIEDLTLGKIIPRDGNNDGVVTDPKCSISSCKRTCDEPQSKLCYNSPGSLNTDNDFSAGIALLDACDPDADNDGVPGVFDCRDLLANVHPAYQYPKPEGGTCPSVAPETPLGSGLCKVAAGVEVCDGEDNDCNGATDNVVLVSGRIIDGQTGLGLNGATMTGYNSQDTQVSVAQTAYAGPCVDADPGPGVDKECGGTNVDCSVDNDCQGVYSVPVVIEQIQPNMIMKIIATSPGFCFNVGKCSNNEFQNCTADSECGGGTCQPSEDSQTIIKDMTGASACDPVTVNPIQMINAPPAGTYTAVLTWDSSTNFESHLRVKHQTDCAYTEANNHTAGCSGGRYCLVGANLDTTDSCTANAECASNVCACSARDGGMILLDVNSTNGTNSTKPETTTIRIRPRARYAYYIYTGLTPTTTPTNVANSGGRVRVWGPGCGFHRLFEYKDSAAGSEGRYWDVFNLVTDASSAVSVIPGDEGNTSDPDGIRNSYGYAPAGTSRISCPP